MFYYYRNILCTEDYASLQTDLTPLMFGPPATVLNLIFQNVNNMILSHKKKVSSPTTPLLLDGFPFDRVYSFKYLGVLLTHDLTWSSHTQMVCNKARKILGLLHKRFYNAPASTLFQLYLSMVRPHLEYMLRQCGCLIWLKLRNWLRVCRGLH